MKTRFSRLVFAAAFGFALALTFGCSSKSEEAGDGTFKDLRDGKTYKYITIGYQTWMAENLNYNVSGSVCYAEGKANVSTDSVAKNCTKYGRLYDWATAMDLPSTCNRSSCADQITDNHRGICPPGWHIPTNADWDELLRYVDLKNGGNGDDGDRSYESFTAGKYLKTTNSWNGSGNGTDDYGFSALPSGFLHPDGNFLDIGFSGYWWSANDGTNNAYYRYMRNNSENVYWGYYSKTYLHSVRCLKD